MSLTLTCPCLVRQERKRLELQVALVNQDLDAEREVFKVCKCGWWTRKSLCLPVFCVLPAPSLSLPPPLPPPKKKQIKKAHTHNNKLIVVTYPLSSYGTADDAGCRGGAKPTGHGPARAAVFQGGLYRCASFLLCAPGWGMPMWTSPPYFL